MTHRVHGVLRIHSGAHTTRHHNNLHFVTTGAHHHPPRTSRPARLPANPPGGTIIPAVQQHVLPHCTAQHLPPPPPTHLILLDQREAVPPEEGGAAVDGIGVAGVQLRGLLLVDGGVARLGQLGGQEVLQGGGRVWSWLVLLCVIGGCAAWAPDCRLEAVH